MKHSLYLSSFLTLTFALTYLSACVIKQPAYCEDFNKLSDVEKREKVKGNSIEINFDLIQCSYYTEGGSPISDEPIIQGGQSSVPFLLTKLDVKDENEQEAAISLLYQIVILKKLQNNADLIAKIEQVVDEMKDESRKKRGHERIADMKAHVE